MNKRTIFIIIAALLVLVGGVAMYSKNKTTVPAITEQTAGSEESATTPASESLDQDFTAIDAKLKAADQDDASIEAGLNDKQGNLSEQ